MGRSTGRSTPPVEASSGQEWHFHISTVRELIPPTEASSGFYISTVRAHVGRSIPSSRGI